MKKTILSIFVLLTIIPLASALLECYDVGFCGGTYNESCNYIANEYCPEDYGDWSGCKENPYSTQTELLKCFPCDPDCSDRCGAITSSMSNENALPGDFITLYVSIYSETASDFNILLYNEVGGSVINGKLCTARTITEDCIYEPLSATGGVYYVNFTELSTSAYGGYLYTYGVYTREVVSREPLYPYTIWTIGLTKPKSEISQPTTQQYSTSVPIEIYASSMFQSGMPTPGSGVTGGSGRVVSDITGMALSNTGVTNITRVRFLLSKKVSEGDPKPADPYNKCAVCSNLTEPDPCNLIAEWSTNPQKTTMDRDHNLFNYSWISSDCGGDSTEFKIKVEASDAYSTNSNEDVEITIFNEDAPCIDNCPKVSSSLLNLVVSKIRVWL